MKVVVVNSRRLVLLLVLGFMFLSGLVVLNLAHLGEDRSVWPVLGAGRRLPIYSVMTEDKKAALTFDAAWGASRTPAILDTLDEYEVRSTFFLVTFWIEDYPEVAQEIAERGHELGLHSSTHPNFTELPDSEIKQELERNIQTIKDTTGQRPQLFRPPFGAYDDRVVKVIEDDMNLTTIQWSVDSLDWQDLTAEKMAQRVLEQIHPGAIVLFHNNGLHTPEALPLIIEELQKQGYELVPVSELLHSGDYHVDHQGRQVPGSP